MQEFDKLKQIIEEVEVDVAKALGGNKAAGTRVRKAMQEVKSVAQDVRKKILETRSAEGAAQS
ncbi:MAG: histone H1 [Phycisphaerales bacterium]|nr:MAG: histone H1 [Phycisphaerales bacterium]